MKEAKERTIMHIDVNCAYLSWEAVHRLKNGEPVDLRSISSIVGGDPVSRHGIVLAKSIPAKKYNIVTGETIYSALQKCKDLTIVPPNHDMYVRCSRAMMKILEEYSPFVERYSIDEAFLDYTFMDYHFGDPITAAHKIKYRIKKELGFTVNIGISTNKLLAKMASDFSKPDQVHTLYPGEIKSKMWPLPVSDLFMVGKATLPKLHNIGIYTIGDLANYDLNIIKSKFKKNGVMIWEFANGIANSVVRSGSYIKPKGIGNSTTIAFDVTERKVAHQVLLALTETVAMRLRDQRCVVGVICVEIKSKDFISYSHQIKLLSHTDCTNEIFKAVKDLFDRSWQGEPIRHFGVRVTELCNNEFYQKSIFDEMSHEKNKALDSTIDKIRLKYGSKSVVRATFLGSGIKPLIGGVGPENYPMMSSLL